MSFVLRLGFYTGSDRLRLAQTEKNKTNPPRPSRQAPAPPTMGMGGTGRKPARRSRGRSREGRGWATFSIFAVVWKSWWHTQARLPDVLDSTEQKSDQSQHWQDEERRGVTWADARPFSMTTPFEGGTASKNSTTLNGWTCPALLSKTSSQCACCWFTACTTCSTKAP